ncbi:MAG: DUF3160 domain-containing protein [Phycisphaerae bacterium]|nr:DUF3160 domain-containing protein [Phycisphaerae bacterium]
MKAVTGAGSVVLSLTFSIGLWAQTPNADAFLQYEAFLAQHKDMTTSELLAMYPTGNFTEGVGVPWDSVSYHERVDAACQLTPYERSLLQDNGFVVTERFRTDSMIDQMVFAWNHDLPLFISADAILHALGIAYDKILIDLEVGVLNGRLCELLSRMQASLPALAARYSADSRMNRMLRDVDLYLTIPQRSLDQVDSAYYADNGAEVNSIVGLIDAESFTTYPLFSQGCRAIDFSQFTPRGHYAEDPLLRKYFRAMMWLGRIELYLLPPTGPSPGCPPQTPQDIQRQAIDAVLLLELMDLAGVDSLYAEMEGIFSSLIGEQDNVTAGNLHAIIEAIGLRDASELLDDARLSAFQQTLAMQAFASQRILSQVLQQDPSNPEAVQPASAFLLFGQRFLIDSYITGNVVWEKIAACRMQPSTLDILFALGNNAAGDLLVPELNQYRYSPNLAALRYLVDMHDTAFWDGSIYNLWLNAIRALNPAQDRGYLPLFMQTTAWSRQKMNTQLASWTELRHNHVLYVKQSYSDWGSCSTPCGYVEPYPELYQRLGKLAKAARQRYEGLSFSPEDLKGQILDYFDTFGAVTEKLAAIAEKELDGAPLSPEETTFIQDTLYSPGRYRIYGGVVPPQGWYASLVYGTWFDPQQMVVDYHTAPSDCEGNPVGWVFHAGTGPTDLAIVTAQDPNGQVTAFVGPVMSYYEYTTTDFKRLTDEEWRYTYLSQAIRPEWVSSYLANPQGEGY